MSDTLAQLPYDRIGLIVLAWLGYFAGHSVLASLTVKRWVAGRWPDWMPAYRLFFNAAAVVLILPPLALTYRQRGPWLWEWTGPAWWVANGLAVAAAFGFLHSLRWYDGAEFLGLRQWRGRVRAVEDQERFHLSPLHRWVRHPWYSLGLVLVWTRDMDASLLVTAVMISLYFVLGSMLEERKLMHYHGEVYRLYRRLVPALIPRPWRHLSPDQAQELILRDGQRGG